MGFAVPGTTLSAGSRCKVPSRPSQMPSSSKTTGGSSAPPRLTKDSSSRSRAATSSEAYAHVALKHVVIRKFCRLAGERNPSPVEHVDVVGRSEGAGDILLDEEHC